MVKNKKNRFGGKFLYEYVIFNTKYFHNFLIEYNHTSIVNSKKLKIITQNNCVICV